AGVVKRRMDEHSASTHSGEDLTAGEPSGKLDLATHAEIFRKGPQGPPCWAIANDEVAQRSVRESGKRPHAEVEALPVEEPADTDEVVDGIASNVPLDPSEFELGGLEPDRG